MLSVITRSDDDAAVLAALLSDLVPGAVSGLVRDVLVLEPDREDPHLNSLCEAAGAVRVRGGLGVAVREARSDLILLAAPGLRLDAFALDRLSRELASPTDLDLSRGLGLSAPAPLGLGFLSRPLGVVRQRAQLLGYPAGAGLEAVIARAAKGAPRLRVAG